jgi:hypothetical protein
MRPLWPEETGLVRPPATALPPRLKTTRGLPKSMAIEYSRNERIFSELKMLTTTRTVTPILVPQTSCDPRPQVRHPLRTT